MVAAAVAALALVAPPSQPGPWHQAGAALISKPGKLGHFFRSVSSPKALGVVAVSSSAKPIRLSWFGYCEVESDDGMTGQNQAVVTGMHRVVAYPPVLTGATMCTVVVTVRVAGGRAAAAVFDY